jgi:hypothetical protein
MTDQQLDIAQRAACLVHDPSCPGDLPDRTSLTDRALAEPNRFRPHYRQVLGRYPIRAPRLEGRDPAVAPGQLDCAADYGLEHGLELERGADSLADLTECARSRVRACTSSKSRTFSIAMTAWSAKVSASSICASVNGLTVIRPSSTTPMGLPSRSSGTPRKVLTPVFLGGPSTCTPGRRAHREPARPSLQSACDP